MTYLLSGCLHSGGILEDSRITLGRIENPWNCTFLPCPHSLVPYWSLHYSGSMHYTSVVTRYDGGNRVESIFGYIVPDSRVKVIGCACRYHLHITMKGSNSTWLNTFCSQFLTFENACFEHLKLHAVSLHCACFRRTKMWLNFSCPLLGRYIPLHMQIYAMVMWLESIYMLKGTIKDFLCAHQPVHSLIFYCNHHPRVRFCW